VEHLPDGSPAAAVQFVPSPFNTQFQPFTEKHLTTAQTRRQRIAISIPLAGLVLFLVFQAAGCGSNNGSPPQHGTQPGTYTVTITGTSGVSRTTTVTLTVN
jgi:hypothetical protein